MSACLARGDSFAALQAQLAASPAALPADGTSAAAITLTFQSSMGAVSSGVVPVLHSSQSAALITNFGQADANGVYHASVRSKVVGTQTLSISLATNTLTVQLPNTLLLTFNPVTDDGAGIPSATRSSLRANPNVVSPDGSSVAVLTLQVNDSLGLPVPGAAVTFAASGSHAIFSVEQGITDATGVLTTTVASTVVETETITAHMGNSAVSTDVVFSQIAPSSAFSTLVASPNSTVADGSSSVALMLTVLDGEGNPVANQTATLSSTGSRNTFTPSSGTTDVNGMLSATLRSQTAETKTVNARVAGVPVTTQVVFTAGAPSATLSTLTPGSGNGTATADGTSTITVSTTAIDAQGNPAPGVTVTLSGGTSATTFYPVSGVSDANGVFTTTVSSTTAGTQTITATLGGSVTTTTSVTFVPGPVSVGNSSFGASPSSVLADGSATTNLTLLVHDAYGNAVSGITVTLSGSGSNNAFSAATGTTNTSGMFVSALSSTTAQAETITATLGGTSLSTPVTFMAGAPLQTTSSIVVSPSTVTDDGVTSSTLVVTVRDINGNPVAGQAVTLSSTGVNVTINPTTGATNGSGAFAATIVSTNAQTVTVTATMAAFTKTATVTFTAGTPSSTYTTISTSSTTVAADGTSTTTVTVTARDSTNNPIAGQSVSLASNGSANTFSTTSGTTSSAGVFTATLASTKAETKTVTATMGALAQNTSVTFVPGAPSVTTTTFSSSPTAAAADGISTLALSVTVKDINGNTVPGQSVALSSTGSNNNFSPVSGSSNASGIFTATLASTKAESKTLTATLGSITKTTGVSFFAGAPSASTSSVAASPASVTADGVTTTTLTVTVKDAQGNPLSGQTVALSSTGTGNTFSPTSGTTSSTGVFTATLASTVAQSKTVTATIGAITTTTDVAFVAGTPSASTSTFVASPTSVTADGTTTTTLTVTARDAQSNLVTGQTVSLSSSGTNNTFSPASGSTNVSGVFVATLASTTAQSKTLTATMGSISKSATVTFTAGTPSSTTSSISANPISVTADGSATTTLTVTVKDAAGNLVSGQTVSLGSTGSSNTFSPATGPTVSGVFTATMTSTKAEAKTITATAGAASVTTNLTFVAGVASSATTTLSASPTSVAADGTSTSTLTTIVLDAQGNPVSAQAVSIAATGLNNTLSPTSGSTNTSGVFTASLASTTVETKSVTVTVGSFTKNATVTFTTPSISNTYSSVVASPTTVTANGVATTTLTVTVRNAANMPVPGQTLTMSSTGSANTFAPPSGTTDGSGVFTATLESTKAETKTIAATVSGTTLNTAVTFVAGSAASATSTFMANPTTAVADGSTTSTLIVVVFDANSNPVSGQAVSFSSSGTNNAFSAASGSTDASGTFTATMTSTKAESKTLTATVGSFTKTATITFTAGGASNGNSIFTASPTSLTADGTSTSTLTLTVNDTQGNPVSGQAVSLSSTGTLNIFSPASGTTNASGAFTATLASTKAETKTVTATAGSVTKNASVIFTAGNPNGTTTSFTASPNSLVADGSTSTTITVTVKDVQGNLVSGQGVTFTSTGTNNTFFPASGSGSTNASGVFTATLASTKAGSRTLTATAGTATNTATVSFTAGSANSTTSSVSASPGIVTADGNMTTTVSITVLDAQGNPVSGQTVSLSSSGSNNTLAGTSGTTNALGVFSTTMSSAKAESKTLTATIGAFTKTTTVSFVAGAASSLNTTFVASPNSVTADGSSTTTLTVTVEDANGNLISGQNVSFSSSGSNNVFAASSGSTTAGVFTTTMSSVVAQTKSITATIGSFTKNASVVFVAGAPSVTTSSLVASPSSLTANGTSASTLTVTVKDAQGNLVSGQTVSLATTGSNNTLTPTSGTTSVGVFSSSLKSTFAEIKTVTATIGSITENANVTFTAGAPSSSTTTLTANPNTGITANGTTTTLLTATVKDAQGNVVSGQLVSFTSTGSNNLFGVTSGNTTTAGVFSTTLKSQTAELKQVTATAGVAGANANATFVAGSVASTSTLVINPNGVTANGTSAATITVTARDAFNNLVSGQSVSLAITGSNNTLGATTGSTNASGVFSPTFKTQTAQQKQVTATLGSVVLNANTTFVGGPVTHFTVSGFPTPINAGTAGLVNVLGLDAYNNVGVGYAGTVHLTSSDPNAVLPSNYAFSAGSTPNQAFSVKFVSATTTGTITVTDTVSSTITGTQSGITVIGNTVVGLSASSADSVCAVLGTGKFKCWGRNQYGQLGMGDTANRGDNATEMGTNLPYVSVSTGRTAQQVLTGLETNCALLDNNQVECWGNNFAGALGAGDTVQRGTTAASMGNALVPVNLGPGLSVNGILAVGYDVGCAILSNTSLKCWGRNDQGALGYGDTSGRGSSASQMGSNLPAINLGSGRTAIEVSAANYTTCAVLDDKSVKCWGDNTHGQLGLGDTVARYAPTTTVPLGTGRTALSVIVNSTAWACALLDNHSLKCWGANNRGQLGVGDTNDRGDNPGETGDALPAISLGTGRTVMDFSSGENHTCAILDNDTLKCWGVNDNGDLGTGDGSQYGNTPTSMGNALPVVSLGTGRTPIAVVAGIQFTCAILDTSQVKCWGTNSNGALGYGDTINRGSTAASLGDGLPVVQIW